MHLLLLLLLLLLLIKRLLSHVKRDTTHSLPLLRRSRRQVGMHAEHHVVGIKSVRIADHVRGSCCQLFISRLFS